VGLFVLAEFERGLGLLAASRRLSTIGYRDIDAHSPYPLDGMDEALGIARSRVPLFVLVGGLVGATFGYLMMYWCNAVDYPLNVGGRPLNSVPAFVPIMFELAILFASLSALVSMLTMMGLPRPYHPVFEVDAFRSASVDRFWVSVRLPDEEAKGALVRELVDLRAVRVVTVEEAT
jgi:hypothetical protein